MGKQKGGKTKRGDKSEVHHALDAAIAMNTSTRYAKRIKSYKTSMAEIRQKLAEAKARGENTDVLTKKLNIQKQLSKLLFFEIFDNDVLPIFKSEIFNDALDFLVETGLVEEVINAGSDEGKTPLHIALNSMANEEQIKQLLDYGADPDLIYKVGADCEYNAIVALYSTLDDDEIARFERIAKLLLPKMKRPFDEISYDLLYGAVDNNNPRLLRFLVEHGFDLNHQFVEDYGNTALHLAFIDNHFEVFVELLNAGADHNIKNEHGKTVMDLINQSDRVKARPYAIEIIKRTRVMQTVEEQAKAIGPIANSHATVKTQKAKTKKTQADVAENSEIANALAATFAETTAKIPVKASRPDDLTEKFQPIIQKLLDLQKARNNLLKCDETPYELKKLRRAFIIAIENVADILHVYADGEMLDPDNPPEPMLAFSGPLIGLRMEIAFIKANSKLFNPEVQFALNKVPLVSEEKAPTKAVTPTRAETKPVPGAFFNQVPETKRPIGAVKRYRLDDEDLSVQCAFALMRKMHDLKRGLVLGHGGFVRDRIIETKTKKSIAVKQISKKLDIDFVTNLDRDSVIQYMQKSGIYDLAKVIYGEKYNASEFDAALAKGDIITILKNPYNENLVTFIIEVDNHDFSFDYLCIPDAHSYEELMQKTSADFTLNALFFDEQGYVFNPLNIKMSVFTGVKEADEVEVGSARHVVIDVADKTNFSEAKIDEFFREDPKRIVRLIYLLSYLEKHYHESFREDKYKVSLDPVLAAALTRAIENLSVERLQTNGVISGVTSHFLKGMKSLFCDTFIENCEKFGFLQKYLPDVAGHLNDPALRAAFMYSLRDLAQHHRAEALSNDSESEAWYNIEGRIWARLLLTFARSENADTEGLFSFQDLIRNEKLAADKLTTLLSQHTKNIDRLKFKIMQYMSLALLKFAQTETAPGFYKQFTAAPTTPAKHAGRSSP